MFVLYCCIVVLLVSDKSSLNLSCLSCMNFSHLGPLPLVLARKLAELVVHCGDDVGLSREKIETICHCGGGSAWNGTNDNNDKNNKK